MESAKQRFFHLLNDLAYIQVSHHPCAQGVSAHRELVSVPRAMVASDCQPGG